MGVFDITPLGQRTWSKRKEVGVLDLGPVPQDKKSKYDPRVRLG